VTRISESQPEVFVINPDERNDDDEEQQDELEKATSFTTVVWSIHYADCK
jgi:hypothetical protein